MREATANEETSNTGFLMATILILSRAGLIPLKRLTECCLEMHLARLKCRLSIIFSRGFSNISVFYSKEDTKHLHSTCR